MKKIIIFLCIFASCSEKDVEKNTTKIKVVEPISNLPVKGANVVVNQCNYGCPFGPKVLFNQLTDDNGVCAVPTEYYNDGTLLLAVYKDKYWPFSTQRNTLLTLEAEGWIELKIHATRAYAAGSKLKLTISNELLTKSDFTEYNIAADSTIMLKAFAGQKNKIDWQVSNVNLVTYGTLADLQVPRLGTLTNSTLNY